MSDKNISTVNSLFFFFWFVLFLVLAAYMCVYVCFLVARICMLLLLFCENFLWLDGWTVGVVFRNDANSRFRIRILNSAC